jgi:hypothetical protein
MSIIQKKTVQLLTATSINGASDPFEMVDTPNPLNIFITGTVGSAVVVIEAEAPDGEWVPVGGVANGFTSIGLYTMKLVTDSKLRAVVVDADASTSVSVAVQGLIV